MNKPKTKAKRIAAAALGIALVLALLTGLSAVTGNPIIAAIGRGRATRHAAQAYGMADAEVSAGRKEGTAGFTYTYTVASKSSPDTHFEVRIPLSGEITDDYDWAVRRLHNTRTRLGDEMAQAATSALADTPYPGMLRECTVDYGYLPPSAAEADPFPDIPYKDAFTLDMPFSPAAVAVPTLLRLRLVGEGASQEALNGMLPEIKAAMEKAGLRFEYYTLIYEKPDALYNASGFAGVYWVEAIPAKKI